MTDVLALVRRIKTRGKALALESGGRLDPAAAERRAAREIGDAERRVREAEKQSERDKISEGAQAFDAAMERLIRRLNAANILAAQDEATTEHAVKTVEPIAQPRSPEPEPEPEPEPALSEQQTPAPRNDPAPVLAAIGARPSQNINHEFGGRWADSAATANWRAQNRG